MVTASADRTARLWDAKTGRALASPIRHPDGVTFAEFDPSGERFVTACADGAARIWDTATGLPRSEPFRSNGRLLAAHFDSRGQRLLTVPYAQVVRVWDTPAVTNSAPVWLPELAEAMTAQRQQTNGTIEYLTGTGSLAIARRVSEAAPGDFFSDWGRWFFADRQARSISPWTSVGEGDWLDRAVGFDLFETLREAAQFRPDHAQALARLTHLTLNQRTEDNPQRLAEADWLSQRAVALAPQDPLVVMARADWIHRQGRLPEAIALMEALPEKARTHGHCWELLGVLLRFAGRTQEALEAFNRSVDLIPASVPEFSNSIKWSLLNRSAILRQLGRVDESVADFHRAMNIQKRDAHATPLQINLDRHYNYTFDENPHDPADTWAAVPRGLQTFNGVEFDLRAIVRAESGRDGSHPTSKIEGIPLGFRSRRLHFLHTAGTGVPDGTPLGKYLMHFANGETRELPLVMERNIDAPWVPTWRPRTLGPNCRIAWTGTNPASKAHDHAIWLYTTTWDNPLPETELESIDIVTFPPRTLVYVFAITGEE